MKKAFFILTIGFISFTSCHNDAGSLPTPDSQSSSSSTSGDDKNGTAPLTIPIPDDVKKAILAKYPGYVISESEKDDGYYKVTVRSGNTQIKLLYTTGWVFVSIKA